MSNSESSEKFKLKNLNYKELLDALKFFMTIERKHTYFDETILYRYMIKSEEKSYPPAVNVKCSIIYATIKNLYNGQNSDLRDFRINIQKLKNLVEDLKETDKFDIYEFFKNLITNKSSTRIETHSSTKMRSRELGDKSVQPTIILNKKGNPAEILKLYDDDTASQPATSEILRANTAPAVGVPPEAQGGNKKKLKRKELNTMSLTELKQLHKISGIKMNNNRTIKALINNYIKNYK